MYNCYKTNTSKLQEEYRRLFFINNFIKDINSIINIFSKIFAFIIYFIIMEKILLIQTKFVAVIYYILYITQIKISCFLFIVFLFLQICVIICECLVVYYLINNLANSQTEVEIDDADTQCSNSSNCYKKDNVFIFIFIFICLLFLQIYPIIYTNFLFYYFINNLANSQTEVEIDDDAETRCCSRLSCEKNNINDNSIVEENNPRENNSRQDNVEYLFN